MSSHRAVVNGRHRSNKRQRVLIACQRCKSRRQKCDGETPACSNCAGANVECVFAEKVYSPDYVKMLEDKIANLEAQVGSTPMTPGQTPTMTANFNQGSALFARPIAAEPARLASGFGVLSSCAASEPHYFGFSAGLSLAHFIQVAIDAGKSTTAQVSLPALADRPFSHQIPNEQTRPAKLPTYSEGSGFIKAYLSTTHRLYPFLNKQELWGLHRYATAAPDTSEVSNLDIVLLHLVYAIGSRCLQLTDITSVIKYIPEGHFMSAMSLVQEAIQFTSIRSIEIVLLLVLHSMRSPSGGSVWHLSGLAIRQCLELGLHKQRMVSPDQFSADQMRKRLFWSAFILERKTSLVLGRPFSIPENEVDSEPPLQLNDAPVGAAQHEIVHGTEPPAYSSISLHVYHITVYRIHTKIRQTVQFLKVTSTQAALEAEIEARFRELDAWKECFLAALAVAATTDTFLPADTLVDSVGDLDVTSDTRLRVIEQEKLELLMEYHKAKRSLLQSLMTEGHSSYIFLPSDFSACATSSGQICQLYRKLNRLSAIPFTLRDLHAVFVAGFTLLYCICLRPSLHNIDCANDIGACSAVLHTIAGQWPSARKYRDAFETTAEVVLERARQVEKGRSRVVSQPSTRHETPEVPIPDDNVEHFQGQALQPETPLLDVFPNDFRFGVDSESFEAFLQNESMDWFTSLLA